MYWNRYIFGVNSIEFKETLLDTAKWRIDSCLLEYSDYYLRHPANRDYPVVGMTQSQATRFSKWRRDRVFEQMLIREGHFEYDGNQTPKNYFTTEKYFAGNYKGIIPDSNVLYPDFRLPTLIERNYIMSLIGSVRAHKNTLRKTDDEFVEKYGTIVGGVSMDFICDNNRVPLYPVYKTFNPKSTEIIHHLRGNVCEWKNWKYDMP
ncbi:hypothetical protein KFE94_14120 [bacterium SCSIO 12643]|nr:hypothetical protein KFE94_14120 [bacterium SCSIO 12643]